MDHSNDQRPHHLKNDDPAGRVIEPSGQALLGWAGASLRSV
jgi:hypothetical protein